VRRHPTQAYDFSELFARIDDAKRRGLTILRRTECIWLDSYQFPGQKQRSATSLVTSSCNADFFTLQHLDHYHTLAEIPSGADGNKCLEVYLPEWKMLQRGFEAIVGPASDPVQAFLYGGIMLGKGDYPQANKEGGFRGQKAAKPCRSTYASQADLGDLTFDIKLHRRTQTHMREVREAQQKLTLKKDVEALLMSHGMLTVPSPLESLSFDPTTQIPPIMCHSEVLGMYGKVVRQTLLDFTPAGRNVYCEVFHDQQLPPKWDPLATTRLSSDKAKKLMCGVEDLKHHAQLAPFALYGQVLKLPPDQAVPVHLRPRQVTYTEAARERFNSLPGGTNLLYDVYVQMAR
jgi:hypothetical protein